MAKKTQAQIEFSAVTKEFDAGVKSMNAQLKTFGNELKLNSTQLKGNADDVGLLQDRQKILQSELEASKTKVSLQEQALAKCKEMLGENSVEYRNLTNSLLQAKNQQAAIENEIQKTEKALANASQETQQAASAWDKLSKEIDEQESELSKLSQEYKEVVLSQGKGSKEAKELEGKINALNSELKENKAEMKKADDAADELTKSLDKLGEEAKDTGDGFTIGKGAIASFIGNGLSSLTSSIGEGISTLTGLSEETKEYRTEMAKLDAAFAETGFSSDQAKEAYTNLYAVLGDEGQAVEATNFLAQLCDNEQQLADWTTICTGVYGKFGASLPVEGLVEAANETAKCGAVTGGLADALNWVSMDAFGWKMTLGENTKALEAFEKATKEGATQEEAFNAALETCSTEQERAALITTTLNGIYGDTAAEFEATNKSVIDANKAQADYTATMAAFGEKVEPITTAVKQGFNGLLQEVLGLTEGADIEGFTSAIQSGFATVKDTVLPAVVEAFGKLKDAWQWLSEHTGLLTAVATVIGVITTAITAYNIVQGIKTAMDAANVTTVWGLVAAHIAQAAAAMAAIAPYILIVAAIAAVIAIIVLCVKHWDKIVEAVKNCWESVKKNLSQWGSWINENVIQPVVNFFKGLWDGIVNIFKSIIEWVKNNWKSIVLFLVNPFAGVFNYLYENFEGFRNFINNIVTSIKNFFIDMWNGIKQVWEWICNAVQVAIMFIAEIIKAAFNIITLPFRFIWENCKEYVFAAWEWIKEKVTTAINAVKTVITTVMNAIKNFFSTVWNGIKNVFTTVWNAIVGFISPIVNKIKSIITTAFNNVKTAVTTIFNAVKSVVTTVWNAIKTAITTVVNSIKSVISTVFNAIKSTVTSIFNAVKSVVTSVWNSIKNAISNVVNAIKTKITSVFNSVKSTVTGVFNGIKSTASSVWNGIKNAITKPIEQAKNKVKSVVDSIKNLFNNMKLKFPKIKMPHFSVKGKFSLDPPQVPKLSISWHAKGGLFTKPTIFANGFGEAGHEYAIPLNERSVAPLAAMITKLERGNIANAIDAMAGRLEQLIDRKIEVALNVDGHTLATATASYSDEVGGTRYELINRGLAIK